MTDERDFEAEYRAVQPLYEQLAEEVKHSVESVLRAANVKVHGVFARAKSVDSFLEKLERKQYADPVNDTPDLAGVRVVCLFLSDLEKIVSVLEGHFQILAKEDKVKESDVDQFGYMSIHFECALGSNYAGPRYDHLMSLKFELQCRTIVMDAWANLSHFLAYKGEASIPEELRRDFYALSGLFYVADRHFELFGDTRNKIAAQADSLQESGETSDVPINVETLRAFLEARYPDRKRGNRDAISEVVERLAEIGIETIGEVEGSLDRVDQLTIAYETDTPPHGKPRRYADVGMVNIGYSILSEEYNKLRFRGRPHVDWLAKYRNRVEMPADS